MLMQAITKWTILTHSWHLSSTTTITTNNNINNTYKQHSGQYLIPSIIDKESNESEKCYVAYAARQ